MTKHCLHERLQFTGKKGKSPLKELHKMYQLQGITLWHKDTFLFWFLMTIWTAKTSPSTGCTLHM